MRLTRPGVKPLREDPSGKTAKDGHDPQPIAGSRTCAGSRNNPFKAPQQRIGAVDWHEWALCRQVDPELFFPEHGTSAEPARRICRQCPVQEECLADALLRHEAYGVFGGMTGQERQDLRSSGKKTAEVAARRKRVQRLIEAGFTSVQIAAELNMTQRMVWRDRQALRHVA